MKKRYIADLHIHSKYSRAVSKDMNIPVLYEWGKKKGIKLIGTGDFTHPLWVRELKESLVPVGNGFYQSKKDNKGEGPYFILSSEISCIYSQGGKVRKIHIVFLASSLENVEKINNKLSTIGNITSDGRPILGISAEDLTSTILEISPDVVVIPAHIWTPWFSLFGANSGFDSINDCFGKVSKKIYAVETGLSSDPAMNWRIKELHDKQIVSFSDAHSPAKLGRESTVIESDFNYEGLQMALKGDNKDNKILYTIEFFPEEGKYHFTGHRNCNVSYNLEDIRQKGIVCPVCGKPLTVGVTKRVEDLASLNESELNIIDWNLGNEKIKGLQTKLLNKPPYVMAVPLMEIIAESLGIGVGSKIVQSEYEKLIQTIGSEFHILLSASLEELKKCTDTKVVAGISKVRNRELQIIPGYDGVFGIVKIWNSLKQQETQEQISLF